MVIRHTLALCGLSAAVGLLAWCGPFWLLPVALLMPACWAAASSRWQAGLVVLVYHLAASNGLPYGAATYFGRPVLGVMLWLGAALILAVTWALLWHSKPKIRTYLLPVALLLVAVPPIGIVGWVHPITAAGCLFPGCGWYGLAVTFALILVFAAVPLRAALGLTAAAVGVAFVLRTPPPGIAEWEPFNTHFDCGISRDFLGDFSRIQHVKKLAAHSPARVAIFAESIGGLWTPQTLDLWQSSRHGPFVVFGSELPIGNADKCDNTLIALEPTGARILYRQRMPIPVSMWRPWTGKGGYRPHWFENPVVDLDGYTVAPLICYEEALVWPILHSVMHHPTVLIAVANDWWARGTTIPMMQINCSRAWARLFSLKLEVSFNY